MNRENEIRQNLRSQHRGAFGWDTSIGLDWNIANKVPIETGIRYLKSFNVPQQLGAGFVRVEPAYVQLYLGVGLNLRTRAR